MKRADFTLPGEAGYEALTLELAKKWGADGPTIDRLIKNARNAKENAIKRKQEAARKAAEDARRKAEEAAAAEEKALEEKEEMETIMVENGPATLTPVAGETLGPDANNTTLGIGEAAGRVSKEASEASHQKYIEGLDAYHQNDYQRARDAWIVAKQLDPGNNDAAAGLKKVEELTGLR